MNPPFVIFLDDGVHIYKSLHNISRDLEAWMVEQYPEWTHGYDCRCSGVKLDVCDGTVRLIPDPNTCLDDNESQRDQMLEFINGLPTDVRPTDFAQLRNNELYSWIIGYAEQARQ